MHPEGNPPSLEPIDPLATLRSMRRLLEMWQRKKSEMGVQAVEVLRGCEEGLRSRRQDLLDEVGGEADGFLAKEFSAADLAQLESIWNA